MFRLSDDDLNRRILGCADGPAGFNAEMNRLGHRVISCDPLYQFGAAEIRGRIEAVYPKMVELTTRERHRFVWDGIGSPEELARVRMAAMEEFLGDYEAGKQEGRYVTAELPALPFTDQAFDVALSSHFLFLYSDELSAADHVRGVMELCRAAGEVRIFPLLDMRGERSRHVGPVMEAVKRLGLEGRLERVPYEFQKGGNEMMRIVRGGEIAG